MRLRALSVFSVILFIFLGISCSKNSDTRGIELSMTIPQETLTDSLFVKMNYKFVLTDEFKSLTGDYRVFVHFWRMKTKEMLFQDDHVLEKSTSQWKAGQTVSYSRVVFIPQFLDELDIDFVGFEEVRLTIGLYRPEDTASKVVLFQKVLKIESASLNAPEKVYDEGWHQPETDLSIKNLEEQSWRWTSRQAVCIIENPRKESLLILRGGVDKAIIPDQRVILKINDKVLDEFIPGTAKFSREYVISAEMLGQEDEFKFIIETDKTFIPSAIKNVKDDRELGVQIFFLYFRENTK